MFLKTSFFRQPVGTLTSVDDFGGQFCRRESPVTRLRVGAKALQQLETAETNQLPLAG